MTNTEFAIYRYQNAFVTPDGEIIVAATKALQDHYGAELRRCWPGVVVIDLQRPFHIR